MSPESPAPEYRVAGVTARLVALVMLPVAVMCGLVASVVAPRGATAAAALDVDRGVVELSALVDLHGAMESQRVLATFAARIRQIGVTREVASDVIGLDVSAEADRSRARAELALDTLGAASPIDRAAAQALFVDASEHWVPPPGERYEAVEEPIVAALARQLVTVEDAARRTNAEEPLVALESLRIVDRMINAAAPQGVAMSFIWVPVPTQNTPAILTELGAASETYTSGARRLRELGSPAVVQAMDAIEGDPRIAAYNAAVARALQGQPVLPSTGGSREAGSAVFRGYTLRASLLDNLVVTATSTVRDGAQELAAAERRAFVGWAAVAAVLTLGTVAVAIACARSISRPLRDLADYAHAVNEGRFDADAPAAASHGPREIRVAGAAFSDLVGSLQLIDAKASALARCAFDDPVLAQPLPGRLGRSLESSVAVLSSSIVERDRLQTHLAHQATHDALTGIPNRVAAINGIQGAISRAGLRHDTMALLFVDLNDFKAVNDRFGHDAGDEVLRQVAARVRRQLRDSDLVARLGGDEFVLVVERIDGRDGAVDLARRVVDAIDTPIDVGPGTVTVGASVGVALGQDGLDDPHDLLARADAAMYRAKSRGRSAIEVFDADLEAQALQREDVARSLADALAAPDGGGLLLHFQPVLDARDSSLAGVEALVRWERPGHGFLPPDSFVPVAEGSSLIIDLDRWVLDAAARQLAAWSDVPELAGVPVAVNISGRHLKSGRLAGHIADVLARTGIDPARLTIEITETVLLDDLVAAAAELEAVRRLGISVAIDDFGTGYTSVAHLQHLPIDTIKIDRSFTNQLDVRRGRSLVRMVTDVGHAIDLAIVAEGVETREELETLRLLGADQLQGYLFSRPLPGAALLDWVRERSPASSARHELAGRLHAGAG